MGRKAITNETILERLRSVHGDRYDYSRVSYVSAVNKVEIICRSHGAFFQQVREHARSQHGCPVCSREAFGEKIALTTDEFIKRAKSVHGDKYDYSKTAYARSRSYIIVGCPVHGDFSVAAGGHLKGIECPGCAKNTWYEKVRYDTSDFISKSTEIHGNTYDYSEVDYVGALLKVRIICRLHGPFMQQPTKHFQGMGCLKCSREKQRLESERSFYDKIRGVHGETYDYSLVKFVKSDSPVRMICRIHGEFLQTPAKHLNGQGCPVCCESNGERAIRLALDRIGVEYVRQWRHPGCRAKNPLPFDFYTPSTNTLIEFDGPQHFGIDWRKKHRFNFEKISKYDSIKTQWAEDNGFALVRIPYTQLNDIPEIIASYFCPDTSQPQESA